MGTSPPPELPILLPSQRIVLDPPEMGAVDQEEPAATMEIAVLTVIKTGSILKNIILNSHHQAREDRRSGTESYLLGRHPDCQIILDHPSISRFHAKLLVEPSRRRLSLTDLSSVHGTWVSGRRVDPGVAVDVGEGEILMFGASTRAYVLKWVPLGSEFELGKLLESVSEECPLQEEDAIDYDENVPLGISIPSVEPELSPPARSGGQIAPSSLLSRRKKSINHLQIHGSKSREQCFDFSMGQVEELVPKALFNNDADGSDDEEEVHFSDNENLTPASTSNQKISKKSTCLLERPCLDEGGRDDQEVENFIVNSRELALELDAEEDVYYESDCENVAPVIQKVKTEGSSLERQGRNLMGQEEQEGFTPDKGNQTPNIPESSEAKEKLQTESCDWINSIIAERRGDDRIPLKSLLENVNFIGNSSFSDVSSPCTEQEESAFRSMKGTVGETSTARRKQKGERVPFRSPLNKSAPTAKSSPLSNCSGNTKAMQITVGKTRIRREDAETNHSQETLLEVLSDVENKASTANASSLTSVVVEPQKSYFSTDGSVEFQSGRNSPERKKWNLVVDIGCLTDDKSRRSLQLLEGIRGTQLTIPSMVIRELDYLNHQESLFRRKSKALVALQWIEQCMVNTGWWIHVQSSGEIASPAPTPPTTPRTDAQTVGNERGEEHDIGVPPNSKPFFAWRDSVAIMSPTAEDHVLSCAVMFRRMKAEEEHVVLTNNISLKIKAMAEGFLCEAPKEFRASLVNPFSKRFLWAGSSPRGLSWSLSEDVEKNENLYCNNSTARKPPNASESARGLKLILPR